MIDTPAGGRAPGRSPAERLAVRAVAERVWTAAYRPPADWVAEALLPWVCPGPEVLAGAERPRHTPGS